MNSCRFLTNPILAAACLALAPATLSAAPGDLDPGFGTGGKVTVDLGTQGGEWHRVAVQDDGKILVTGVSSHTNGSLWLSRYLADGSLDASFGSGGQATIPFGSGHGLALQADGKILVAGRLFTSGGMAFGLARFQPNGVLDAGFGTGGLVRTDVGSERAQAYSVAVQADGKIVVAGVSHIDWIETRMVVTRYLPDGSLDPSFGEGGKVMPYVGIHSDEARGVAIQGDGKIVVGGWCEDAFGFSYFAVLRLLADGTPDPAFGNGGKVVTEFASNADNQCHDMALQPDGKILLGGFTSERGRDFALVRYRGDGTLDGDFGSGGRALTDFDNGSQEEAYALALQGDGKIVLAGGARSGNGSVFALVRHLPDGSLDASFGSGGKVLTALADPASGISYLYGLAVQKDGKIVAVGNGYNGDASTHRVAMVRYLGTTEPEIEVEQPAGHRLADGGANIDFGSVPVVGGSSSRTFTIRNASTATLVGLRVSRDGLHGQDFTVVQPAASLLGPGASATFTVNFAATSPGLRRAALHIASNDADENPFDLTVSGTGVGSTRDSALDPAFGSKGRTVTAVAGPNSRATDLALRGDGKIVLAGCAFNGSNYDFALARYHADGNPDATFGNQGLAVAAIRTGHDFANGLAIQGDDKLVVAGRANNGSNDDLAVARFLPDGALDPSFGSGGKVTANFGTASGEIATDVAIQAGGKILIAGYCDSGTLQSDFALARLLPGGAADSSFGNGGLLVIPVGAANDRAFGLALQGDGKIVVAGTASRGTREDLALVRLHPGGALDTSFGNGGKVTTAVGNGSGTVRAVAVQQDGKIVAAGGVTAESGGTSDVLLVRYLATGTPDPGFGSGGMVVTDVGGGSDETAVAVAVQSDGKILVAGSSDNGGTYDFALLRYRADGTPDASFGNGGKLTIPVGAGDDFASGLALQPDGMIVMGGDTRNGADNDFALVRCFGTVLPEIAVEQPAGTNLTDGVSTVDFGGAALDGGPVTRTFTIRSPCTAGLGPLSLSRDGADAGDFTLGSLSSSWTNPGESVTFAVSFLPSAGGPRTATLHIASNDADENPFDIVLTGTGLVPPEIATRDPLPSGMVGTPYNLTFAASGGSPPYTWTVSGGSPPPGLALGAAGLLDGAPSQATVTPAPAFEVRVTDARGFSATKSFSLAVIPALEPGDLDPSFGNGGKVTTAIGAGNDYGQAVAVQADGGIVVAGYATVGTYENFALVRYRANGAPDTAFGSGGVVTTSLVTYRSFGRCVALQPDGKILVAGDVDGSGATDIGVARYLANGALDPTFGSGGKVVVSNASSNDYPKDILLQADGKIVVAGAANTDFGVVRLNPNGSLDGTFGTGGKVVTDFNSGSFDYAEAGSLQADGKIVVAGRGTGSGGTDFILARYLANGALDPGFGSGGKLSTAVSPADTTDICYGLAVQADGKIVAAGYTTAGHEDFALARYLADGTLDNSFGTGGTMTTGLGIHSDRAMAAVVQGDGAIVVAGYGSNGQNDDFGVLRLLSNGTRDSSFGSNGGVLTPVGASQDRGRAVALGADGKIVVAGESNNGTNYDFALVRYVGPPAAEIEVEQPAGNALADAGAGVDFGAAEPGGAPVTRTFTVRNTGSAPLTGLTLAKNGTHAADFAVEPLPTTSLAPGASVSFDVSFSPGAAGGRSAALHLASSDADENPFDIALAGSGGSGLQVWRMAHFGSAADSGNGANANDFDHDGLENLLEYAFGGNPKVPDAAAVRPVVTRDQGTLAIAFRCDARCTDIVYTVQASMTLKANEWTDIAKSPGGGPTVQQAVGFWTIADAGAGLRTVKVTEVSGLVNPLFLRIKVSE